MRNWQTRQRRFFAGCGDWYWNTGAHAEACRGEPLERRRGADQLKVLPGESFEDLFACEIDESAGLREDVERQMT